MSLQELIPALRELPRVEKLRLVQFLVNELAREAELTPLQPHAEYPVWSPYDASEAAETLLTLEHLKERAQRGGREKYEAVLAKVPDVEPEEYDRL